MDWLGEHLGYKSMDEWYQVSASDFHNHGGRTLIGKYHDSVSKLLQNVYPHHTFLFWKFENVPRVWHKMPNQILYFDWLGKQLGYKTLDDWYKVTVEDFRSNGGGSMLTSYYASSPSKALQTVYNGHNWDLEKFDNKPHVLKTHHTANRQLFIVSQGSTELSWEDESNHLKFFDWMKEQLGYKTMDDWYSVTSDIVCEYGGASVLKHFNGSPSKALQTLYPQHNWMLWRFKSMPQGHWQQLLNNVHEQKQVLDFLSDQLRIQSLNDWYRISMHQMNKWINLGSVNVLSLMLRNVYPQHTWDLDKWKRVGKSIKAGQRQVVMAMQQLFPKCSKP